MSAPPLRPLGFKPVFVFTDEHGAFHVEISAPPQQAGEIDAFDVYTAIQDAAAALFLRVTQPGEVR